VSVRPNKINLGFCSS